MNTDMKQGRLKTLVAAGALIAGMAVSGAAFAGDCPAGSTGMNVMKPGPMQPSGVTDTVIATVDLAGYGTPGKMLRMRRLVMQPGGIVPWHSHSERPANIYIVSGSVTEYRSTCAVPIVHAAGDVTAESGNLSHWWKNTGSREAVILSADVFTAPPPAMSQATSSSMSAADHGM